MLQNLEVVVGKRDETETERKRQNKPLFSVVMDEFAPFGYSNFAQILNTARGTNTAFLFSLQSLPQLLEVGKGFQQDVSSAPGTTMLMQTRDEETAKYFKQASSQIPVQKRTQQLWRNDFLGFERYDKAMGASEREQLECRARDHHIKNLGKGKMEILMTDPIQGTLHGRLHVRPPSDVRVPLFEPTVLPKLESSREDSEGANLRFKDQKLAAMVAFPRRQGANDVTESDSTSGYGCAGQRAKPEKARRCKLQSARSRDSVCERLWRSCVNPRSPTGPSPQAAAPRDSISDSIYAFSIPPDQLGNEIDRRSRNFREQSSATYSPAASFQLGLIVILLTKLGLVGQDAPNQVGCCECLTDALNAKTLAESCGGLFDRHNRHIELCNRYRGQSSD